MYNRKDCVINVARKDNITVCLLKMAEVNPHEKIIKLFSDSVSLHLFN